MRKLVVVTGGGTGIGRATARAFAEHGCRVIAVGRRSDVLVDAVEEINAAPEVVASGGCAGFLVADLTNPSEASYLTSAVAERGGQLDVLVNNAGGNVDNWRPKKPMSATALPGVALRWEDNWRANVLTAVLATSAVLPQIRRGTGRVVCVSSIAAHTGGGGSYGAAKASLHAYVFALAAELGPQGITANVVAPGYIEDTEFFAGGLDDERAAGLVARTLVGRAGAPVDVAAAIRWLASEEAGYVTGEIVRVNGGADLGL